MVETTLIYINMVENRKLTHVKWVWVDLDDTLIDFKANSRAALVRLYETEGLSRRFADSDTWIEMYESVNRPLWKEYGAGRITVEELRLRRFLEPLTRAGYPDDEAMEMSLRYDTYYLDLLAQEKHVVEGAHELLRTLRSRGYNIGVLSNGFADVQHRKMASAGLTDMVDCVVLSDDIGVPKPDGRIFAYAMRKVGEENPSLHAMVGDNPVADIGGAIAAGWSGVLFDPSGTKAAELSGGCGSTVVRHLSEVEELFAGRMD